MRIISGTARGRTLTAPPSKDNTIRPTADRAREALFSILGQKVVDADILDLFAGTGALGLEAFSRGAKRVVFVDKGHTALQVLKQNLSIFSCDQITDTNLRVIRDDLKRPNFISKFPGHLPSQFDIVFADPPYGKDFALPILEYICKENLLTKRGTIVIEEKHTVVLPDHLASLKLFDRRRYGEACFSFYRIKQSNPGKRE